MKYLLLLALLYSHSSIAEDICPPVKSKAEGHWPLPEKAFSKDAAKDQLKALDDYFEGKIKVAEEFIYQSNIILEGSFLRMEVEAWKDDPENYKYAKTQFCKFMVDRAYVVH